MVKVLAASRMRSHADWLGRAEAHQMKSFGSLDRLYYPAVLIS